MLSLSDIVILCLAVVAQLIGPIICIFRVDFEIVFCFCLSIVIMIFAFFG